MSATPSWRSALTRECPIEGQAAVQLGGQRQQISRATRSILFRDQEARRPLILQPVDDRLVSGPIPLGIDHQGH